MSKQAIPPPPVIARPRAPPPPPRWQRWVWPIAVVLPLLLAVWLPMLDCGAATEQLNYSRFLTAVDGRQVKTITIDTDGQAHGTMADGHRFTTVIPTQAGPALLDRLSTAQVEITAARSTRSYGAQMLSWTLIIAAFLLIFWFWRRLVNGGSGQRGAFGAGKAKA